MADKKIYRLILGLYHKTQNGEVKWERSIDLEFIASFQDYSVGVSRGQLRYRSEDYAFHLKIYDATGQEIESASSADFENDPNLAGAYNMLSYIYENARRMALGVDTALDTLLMELGA